MKKLVVPGVIGNMLEWYDFSLYGYFAPVIATLFFPTQSKASSLLATFGVFAMGYLMRPVGAAFFGYFGDRIGRKATLAATVLLMAIPTTLIGILPTYNHIGVWAPILLTTCRLLQGLAVGGGFSGSIVYIIEHAPQNQRGLYGSWANFSAYFGFLLSSGVGAFVGHFSSGVALEQWGWRIPFMFGSVLGVVGLYLRMRMPETPNFLALKASGETLKNPLLHVFKNERLAILKAIGLVFLPSMTFYIIFVYLSTYLTTYAHVPLETTLQANTISMAIVLSVMPFMGKLSDKIGRKPMFIASALILLTVSYGLFNYVLEGSFGAILLVQSLFAIIVCVCDAIAPTTLVEMFPTNVRYTAISLAYNVAYGVFGGTAPLAATFLIERTGSIMAPSFYLMFAAVFTLFILRTIKETYKECL